MLKKPGGSGGPEEDRTPDLFIANDGVTRTINSLRCCCSAVNRPKAGGKSTNRAQSKICAKLAQVIARFRAWWRTDDTEERYCWRCRDYRRHTKRRGCLECDWADRL